MPGPDWLAWGGPSGDFVVESAEPLAERWPKNGPPVLWKRPLGPGHSSVLHRDGVLYTLYRQGGEEVVVALEAQSGHTLWEHRRAPGLWPDMSHSFGLGPNATPLLLDQALVAIDISGYLRALQPSDGSLLWQMDLPATFGRLERVEEYGYSGNPLAQGDTVLVLVGGSKAAVVALAAEDGSLRWMSAPGGVSYAQPTLTRLANREHYLYFEPEGLVALDPETGRILWKHPIEFNNGNHLTPVVRCDPHHLWVGSQFSSGGGRLLRILESERAPQSLKVEEVWFERRRSASHWTLVPQGEYIYGSLGGNRTSYLAAMAWRTGELAWKKRGFHKAQVLWADEKLLLLDESGELALARASEKRLEILDRAEVLEANVWTLPTLVGSTLFLRDQEHLLALDLGVPSP